LPLEFQSFELPVAERLPEKVLRLGGIRAHTAGEFAMAWWCEAVDHISPSLAISNT
jgi:hypothetical protein